MVGWLALGVSCGSATALSVVLPTTDAAPVVDAGSLEAGQQLTDGSRAKVPDPIARRYSCIPANEPTAGSPCEASSPPCEDRDNAGCSPLYTCQQGLFASTANPRPLDMSCRSALRP